MNSADLSTRDLTSCRLKLSDELIFAPQQHAGSTYYHIEAPSKGQFYRVGYPEYVFLSLLDGRTTLAQAVTLSARALGAKALSQPQALEVALWLLENGLARFADDPETAWRTSAASRCQDIGRAARPESVLDEDPPAPPRPAAGRPPAPDRLALCAAG